MTPILNVFPLSQAPSGPPADRNGRALSVYWFSQTIGPGRGLEFFIKAMGKMRSRVTLSVRGSDFLGYSAKLKTLAAEVGVTDALSFLPSAPPDEMARLAAQHDIGLAFELNAPPNHGDMPIEQDIHLSTGWNSGTLEQHSGTVRTCSPSWAKRRVWSIWPTRIR